MVLAFALGGFVAPGAPSAQGARDFEALWKEAQYWASETQTAPEDCVFSFRFDPKTKQVRDGYAVTCDEPYRSPLYPWPEPSRPDVRFTPDDIKAYGLKFLAEQGVPSRRFGISREEQVFETCGLVVGFTNDGRGAEAIECYWIQGSVMGKRANTGFVVEAASGRRVASRLDNRIAHLGDREARDILRRHSQVRSLDAERGHKDDRKKEVVLRVEGRVIAREADRLRLWGRAVPLIGESSTEPGVLPTPANIVVHYPSDDALTPDYYLEGKHCFEEKRERSDPRGVRAPEWVYGPCPLGPDQYWVFERYPLGRKTLVHGPYRGYGECDRDRKQLRAAKPGVGGHCLKKAKVAFRMTKDMTLVIPKGAPTFE